MSRHGVTHGHFWGRLASEARSLYLLGEGKTEKQVLNDIWHALFSFKDEERLQKWACKNLQLTEKQAQAFAASGFRRIMPP